MALLQLLMLALPLATAFDCTKEAFQAILPTNATVTSATYLPENSTYQVPASNIAYPISPTQLRALCAVEIKVPSSPTSAYSFGLFLPEGWNERFLAVGNGGFAGGINWLDMAAGVGYGFATISTDTGHNSLSTDGSWALNKESLADWGYRAMHGSVVLAKQVVETYYARRPRYNYYSGCSTGGRQGIRDLQLYPEDFDGVLAGAPAWWTSHLQTWTVKIGLYNLPVDAPHHIPTELFPIIEDEVLKQCDPQDGIVDSIISDPRGCNFFAEALLCRPNVMNQTAAGCLTAAQIGTLYKVYSDYVDTNQTFVFPHLELGSEAQFEVLMGSAEPNPLGTDYVRYFLLDQPDWNFNDFNLSIVELADQIQPGNATAYDYDMAAFQARGGKLLHYHGLADAYISTGSSEYFYKQVLKSRGDELDSWYRFFLVPGMGHCGGTSPKANAPWYFAGGGQAGDLGTDAGRAGGVPGIADSEHDALLSLMQWTENGTAPRQIIATKWKNDTLRDEVLRQRPICPYHQHASLVEGGDPDDAASWACVLPPGLRKQVSH